MDGGGKSTRIRTKDHTRGRTRKIGVSRAVVLQNPLTGARFSEPRLATLRQGRGKPVVKIRQLPRFSTIYDFAIAYAKNTDNTRSRPNAATLYNAIASYLVDFTMADLCHDFRDLNVNVKLDSKAGSMSIGEHMCEKACAAFYPSGSDEWLELKRETYGNFLNQMGSDGRAKKYIAMIMPEFFTDLKNSYSEFFERDSYEFLFESCAGDFKDVPYDDDASKNAFINEISNGGNTSLVALAIDSQNSNPVEDLFMREPFISSAADRINYLTNFGSVLDPASKPSLGVERFMNIFVQSSGLPTNIPKIVGVYNTKHNISNLRYANNMWNIDSKFNDDPIETINSANKVSVNNQGVFKSRNTKVAVAAADIQVIKNAKIDNVGLDHHLKTCGDNYQSYAQSTINEIDSEIKYKQISALQSTTVAGKAQIAADFANPAIPNRLFDNTYIKILITLDKLLARRGYNMLINVIESSVERLSFYRAKPAIAVDEGTIRAAIIANIGLIYGQIKGLENKMVRIDNVSYLIDDLYIALQNNNTLNYCKSIPILELFTRDSAPTAAEIETHITEYNYKQYYYMQNPATILDTLKKNSSDALISRSKFDKMLGSHLSDILNNLDESLLGLGGQLTEATLQNYYRQIQILNDTLKTVLGSIFASEYLQLLAHLIIIMHNKKRINQIMYNDMKLFSYLTMSGRRFTIFKAYEGIREDALPTKEWIAADEVFRIFFDKAFSVIRTKYSLLNCSNINDSLNELYGHFTNIISGVLPLDLQNIYKSIYAHLNSWFSDMLALKAIEFVLKQNNQRDRDHYFTVLMKDVLKQNYINTKDIVRITKPNILLQAVRRADIKSQYIRKAKAQIKDAENNENFGESTFTKMRGLEDILPDKRAGLQALVNANPAPSGEQGLFTNLKFYFRKYLYFVRDFYSRIAGQLSNVGMLGGGSNSRKNNDNSTASILQNKLNAMQPHLFNADHYGIDLLRSENLAYRLIVSKKEVKSHSRPVVLSAIKEEQNGGVLQTRRQTESRKSKSRTLRQSRERDSQSRTFRVVLGNTLGTKTGSRKLGKYSTNEYIDRQILSLFLLGYKLSNEDISVLSKYLPDFADISMANVHRHLFWQPFMDSAAVSLEKLDAYYATALSRLKSDLEEPKSKSRSVAKTLSIKKTGNSNSTAVNTRKNRPMSHLQLVSRLPSKSRPMSRLPSKSRPMSRLPSKSRPMSRLPSKSRPMSRLPSKSRGLSPKSLSRDVGLGYSEIEA